MNGPLFRTRAKGQSIPLIALVIILLIAMVGLAVDVNNTYAKKRETARAVNAAAITAMNRLMEGQASNEVIYNRPLVEAVLDTLRDNGLQVAATPEENLELRRDPPVGSIGVFMIYLNEDGPRCRASAPMRSGVWVRTTRSPATRGTCALR
ncbi:MAG: hypothetical protein HC884_19510 [Chloroflexaceae bacterium]|nr:hypothetical protein [Chloroflexaceae bacterium]